MTSIADFGPNAADVTARADVVLALCCGCGEIRSVSRRAAWENRPLRCAACKRTTTHAPVGLPDWREADNDARAPSLCVDDMLGLLRTLGADVRTYESSKRRTVGIDHYLDDGAFFVSVNLAAPDRDLRRDLERALDHVADPDGTQWFVRVADGVPMANIQWHSSEATR